MPLSHDRMVLYSSQGQFIIMMEHDIICQFFVFFLKNVLFGHSNLYNEREREILRDYESGDAGQW